MYLPLLEQFRNYLSSKGVSKITAKNYLSDIRKFLTWFETQFSRLFVATDLTVDVIELFEKTKGATIQNKNDTEYEILNTEYSSRSLERYLSALRKFAKFLVEEKLIDADPFEILNTKYEILNTKQDPWHLKEFRDYLYVYGAAKLTIKNYTVDILAFTKWIEITVLASRGEALQGQGISLINQELIEDYKERLTSVLELSPKSVNRKLSSIRKYLQFAVAQNLIKDLPFVASQGETLRGLRAQTGLNLDDLKETEDNQQPIINNQYSKFPPLRLLQKMFVPYELLEDRLSSKIARAIRNFRLANRVSKFAFRRTTNDKRRTFPIGNIPKVAYAPQQISLANKAWHKKLFHHARYTRPNWYKRYHSYAFTHYFHFAILVIYASLIGFLIYTALFSETQDKQALAAPVAPPRILSFQGRLTDQNDNPITTATDLRFQVYDDSSTTGSGNLLWQEVIEVSPDQDGIFSELLGNGSTCTGQPLTVQQTRCAIPSSVFTDNSALYLGISVENTAELTPRQRLATVAYAANSESLQGMLPITDAAVTDNVNTILALDSSGNLTMDGATTPTFQATGGQFKISGQPLLLTTNTGTSNNVIIDPDGIGKVDVRKPLANTTATGNISPGGVEVDDKFGVLATESAVAAFVVNNNTTGGDIFTASSSGTTRFTLSNAGVASFVGGQTADITSLGNANLTVSAGGTGDLRLLSDSDTDILLPYSDFTSTNSVLYSAETTGKLSRATTVSSNLCLVSGASAPSWSSCGAAAGDDWDVTNGAIYPKLASTLDLLIGGTTTASAKFAFINVNSGNPTATISGNLALAVPTTAGANTLDLFNNSTLNIRTSVGGDAGATTALFIDKRGNSGRVGIGTTGPDAPLDVLSTGGTQLRLTYADGSTYTDINTDTNGDLTIAPSGGDTNITGTLDVSGHGAFGGGASVSTIYILNAQENITAGAGSTYYGGFFAPVFTTTAGAQTQPSYGAYFSAGLGAGNNQDWTNSVMGLNSVRASLSITAGATGTITHAADFLARSDGLGAATITNYYGLRVDNPAGAGTVTNTYGIYVQNLTKGATADYGIYVAGADTYALWVDTGTSRFDGLIDAQGGVTVASGQNLTLAGITGNNAVLYGTTGTGVVTSATTSTSGQCLLSGAAAGYTPSWTTCPGGVDTTDVFWGQSSGLLYPNNSTVDLSIGGQSTASAKFAFINVNSGNPTATISGNLALAVPTTAGANTLDLLNNSTLNIRTSVGGDAGATTALFIDKRGNSGNIGISDTTPDASLEVVNDGSGDSFLVADTNDGDTTPFVIQSDGDVGIGTANPQVKLDIVGGAGGAVSRDVLREVISGEAGIHISRRGLNAYGISFGQSLTDALDTTTVPPWAIIFEGDALNIRRGAANQAVHAVNPLVSITSAGNVGIGTTAPDARLEINHATGDSLRLTYNDSDGSAANYTDLELASDGSLTLTSTGADVTFVSDFNTGVNIGASTNTPAPLSISGGIGSNAAFVVDQLNSGDIIAASASGTTKFTLSNAGVLTLVGGQTPDITTQTNATFTITPNGTGNLILGSDFDSGTTIGTAITGEFPLLIRSGIGSNAALVIDQLNSADIFSASASGVTKFTISNSGDVTFAGGDITGANGAAIDIGEATSGDIEITGDLLPASDATYDLGSTTKSWQNIYLTGNLCFDDTDCMSTSTTGYWDQTNGALYPKISTVDLLIGGTSTASAKFAVLNMSGTGTPVASVSSGLSGTSAYLTADGTLATQNRMALTIGNSSTYNTTGNVLINPNGTGNVGIGTTGPGYLLDVNGLAHAATALVVGTNPATGGSLRLPTDTGVNVRNEANTLNIQLIGLSSGNVLRIGGGGDVAPAGVNVNTGTVGLYPESDNDSPLGTATNRWSRLVVGTGISSFAGNVGIGTTDPLSLLHVSGGNTGGRAALIVDQTGAATNDIMAASASGTTKFRLTNGGAVYAASFYDLDNSSYFLDPAATNISLATVGKVGIGTINPGMALEVNALSGTTAITKIQGSTSYAALNIDQTGVGDLIAASLSAATKFLVKNNGDVVVGAGGAGKITVTTIDPLYNIDGGKYSTYAPSMIGVKEEITGKASTVYDETQGAYAYTLDFNSFEQSSDFWVFSRVIDPDIERVSVLLTPNSQARTWYRKDPVRRLLTFYSDRPTEISYRLTAPRFDYERWGTISSDTEAGFAAPPAPPPAGNGTPDGQDDFFANLNIKLRNGVYELIDSFGSTVKRVEGFSDLIAANLTAGLINAQDITTNTLAVTNDSVTIAGQSLRDYISTTVSDILNTEYSIPNTGEIISPLASIDEVRTNIISPLADNQIDIKGDIAIKDKNNQTVAKIDTKGDLTVQNASISGSLVADSARVNSLTLERFNNAGDATVSGTLYADKIQANSIEGLEAKIASIAAESVLSSKYNVSSISGEFDIASILNTKYLIPDTGFLDIENLSADFATFRDGLIALGPATFNQASVLESFSIGNSFIFGPNSMDTLGLDLEIQPLKQGAISLMAGAVRINTDGTLVVNENATFAKDVSVRGKLSANIISPLPDQDLILHLGRWRGNDLDSSEVDGLPRGGKLEVQNSSDSAVLSVNQAGDLTSSGSGTFAKLNLFTQPVEAVSDTEVVATSSAGTAILKRYRTELTISNPLVTDKSLIYITPVGNTNGQALYLLRQVPASTAGGKESFTVGVAAPAIADIKFNWIIVN